MSSAVGSRPAEPWEIHEPKNKKIRHATMEQSAMRTRRKGSAGAPEPARDAGRELKPLRSLCGREKSGERRCRAGGGRCDAAAKHRLGAGECPCPGGRPVVGHLHAVEMRPRAVPGTVADPRLGHSRASAWYGQQGEHFVAVDHRRCIRMPFVPPCLMYNLSILQKRCATNGSARQKLGKRYERRKTHGLKNISICVR